MFLVEVDVQCSEQHSELLTHEVKKAEILIEELVAQILLELYEAVLVDEITINYSARSTPEQVWYDILILARCSHPSLAMGDYGREYMEPVLEGKFSSALLEFFGMVEVKRVMITVLSAARIVI